MSTTTTKYTKDSDGFRVREKGFVAVDDSNELIGFYDTRAEAEDEGTALPYVEIHRDDLGKYRNTTVDHTFIDPDGYAD